MFFVPKEGFGPWIIVSGAYILPNDCPVGEKDHGPEDVDEEAPFGIELPDSGGDGAAHRRQLMERRHEDRHLGQKAPERGDRVVHHAQEHVPDGDGAVLPGTSLKYWPTQRSSPVADGLFQLHGALLAARLRRQKEGDEAVDDGTPRRGALRQLGEVVLQGGSEAEDKEGHLVHKAKTVQLGPLRAKDLPHYLIVAVVGEDGHLAVAPPLFTSRPTTVYLMTLPSSGFVDTSKAVVPERLLRKEGSEKTGDVWVL
uniref:Uncharacterized protein n=1 Tax=Steinernema glaseri TaxID=37863 RepID=A0A1I7ZI44_9BILA